MTSPCAQTARADAYLAGELTDDEQARFEEHYFECESCFNAVQHLQDLQAILPANRHAAGRSEPIVPPSIPLGRRIPAWAMVAAASLIAVAVLWGARTMVTPPADPAVATAAIPTAVPPAPPESPAPTADPWLALAVVTPPIYAPLPTRSATGVTARAFEAAMAAYTATDYEPAAAALSDLASRTPADARVQFFLGVARLLAGQPDTAKAPLARAVSIGLAPYADEAHFYLAKAALATRDRAQAEAELRKAIAVSAGPEGEAARLLSSFQALPR